MLPLSQKACLLERPCNVQQGHCSSFDQAITWQVAPADNEEFRDYAKKQAWQALVENLTLIQVIREQCILCGRFLWKGTAPAHPSNASGFVGRFDALHCRDLALPSRTEGLQRLWKGSERCAQLSCCSTNGDPAGTRQERNHHSGS